MPIHPPTHARTHARTHNTSIMIHTLKTSVKCGNSLNKLNSGHPLESGLAAVVVVVVVTLHMCAFIVKIQYDIVYQVEFLCQFTVLCNMREREKSIRLVDLTVLFCFCCCCWVVVFSSVFAVVVVVFYTGMPDDSYRR